MVTLLQPLTPPLVQHVEAYNMISRHQPTRRGEVSSSAQGAATPINTPFDLIACILNATRKGHCFASLDTSVALSLLLLAPSQLVWKVRKVLENLKPFSVPLPLR